MSCRQEPQNSVPLKWVGKKRRIRNIHTWLVVSVVLKGGQATPYLQRDGAASSVLIGAYEASKSLFSGPVEM